MIYKSKVEFEDHACNHVVGCTHDCKYPCYAQNIALRTGMIKNRQEWSQIKLKPYDNIMETIRKDVKKLKSKIKEVHLCFMTDVFMFNQPEVIRQSLGILNILKNNNVRYKTLTKGIIPYKEIISIEKNNPGLDLFENTVKNDYGISLVSLDEKFRETWEPGASKYKDRVESLKKLQEAKLRTYVYMEPFSPEDTSLEDFKKILSEIGFVKKIIIGSWQYNSSKKDKSRYAEYINYFKAFCDKKKIEYKIKKEIANIL